MAVALDFRNVNSLWCSVLAETLSRCGVRQAVICPGSRSTPLAFAFARHGEIEAIPVMDERSASFFALGLAKQRGEPVVLVCTSGTAGANFHSAIIEAWHSGVPLIVLTADRPPEMRECSSGQTIDQQKLFGAHVNFYHELAVPEARMELLRYLRQTAAHACERSQWPAPGPVHLNAPFRDPLPPVADGLAGKLRALPAWRNFFDDLGSSLLEPLDATLPTLPTTARGLVIAGPAMSSSPAVDAVMAAGLANGLGWPLLADGFSGVRNHSQSTRYAVTAYDTILRNPKLAKALRPEHVICLGDWPVSKVLRAWLEDYDGPVWCVHEGARNPDALHRRTRWLRVPVRILTVAAIRRAVQDGRQSLRQSVPPYCRLWLDLEARARGALERRLRTAAGLFEGRVSSLLAQHLPAATSVFVANSMPVRDVDYFWPANDAHARIHFNRGANGIDGTLSSALGIAHGGAPAVLLTGDLALLHDSNGFLIGPKFRGSLTIVLINNRGGGIFEHLPVAQFDPPFEEFVATPQKVDFAKLCAAHGVHHVPVKSWAQFTKLIATLPSRGIRVLEVRTDRKRDAATRKKLLADTSVSLTGSSH